MFLSQTSVAVGDDGVKNFNKLEKADILELAVEHLQMLQNQSSAIGLWTYF